MESERDEANLIEAARFGDVEAIEVLVDTYMDDIFLHVLQAIPDPLAAERVAEDVFRTMIARLPEDSEAEAGSFEAWLQRIADEEVAKFLGRKGITEDEAS